jgi:hypothetical protein
VQDAVQPRLVLTDSHLESLARNGYAFPVGGFLAPTPDGIMGLGHPCCAGILPCAGGLDHVGLTSTSDGQAEPAPGLAERAAVASRRLGEIDAALTRLVSTVKLEKIARGEVWMGHIYNLETMGGWYVANSIITHNCRCDLLPVLAPRDEDES